MPAYRTIDVALDEEAVEAALALGIDPAAVAADALRDAVRGAKAAAWAEENREALAKRRDYVEEHGLPLQELRRF